MEKRQAQRRHAKRRAAERYGLTVNRVTLRDWVQQVIDGKARLLERRSLRVATYVIQHEDQEIVVVYDRQRKTIVTCLPAQKGEQP